jgi:hypothetical protein
VPRKVVYCSSYFPMAGLYELSNAISGPIKVREFLDLLSDFWLFKNFCPCRYLYISKFYNCGDRYRMPLFSNEVYVIYT